MRARIVFSTSVTFAVVWSGGAGAGGGLDTAAGSGFSTGFSAGFSGFAARGRDDGRTMTGAGNGGAGGAGGSSTISTGMTVCGGGAGGRARDLPRHPWPARSRTRLPRGRGRRPQRTLAVSYPHYEPMRRPPRAVTPAAASA